MRTRAVLTSAFASIGVLAIGWQAGASMIAATTAASTTTTTASSATTIPSTGSSSSGSSTTTTTPSATPTAPAAPAAASSDGTWTGSLEQTRFGTVQVSVTISSGAITEVTALKLTDSDGRSIAISNQAAPMLRQEVLSAQSANVSTIGGATYTSVAYLASLQSALDQAGF